MTTDEPEQKPRAGGRRRRDESRTPPVQRVGAGLGPAERVKLAADFARVYRDGRRGGDAVLRVAVAWNDSGIPRIALAVGKKIGRANVRNRLRRLYREAFRLEKRALPPVDVVASPSRDALAPTLAAVRESLVRVVRQTAARLPARKPAPEPAP